MEQARGLFAMGCPTAPTDPLDDAAWKEWETKRRAWRQHMDALFSTAIFALDEQVTACGLLEGDCEVCDLSDEMRHMLYEQLSPEGRSAVDFVRRVLPLVEAELA